MTAVEFRNVTKSYGEIVALDNVTLSVASGEFLTLLGPSGSGKSTLLNVLSGMMTPSSGSILIDGQDVTGIPARLRGLGMVFQNYALFPHMTVFENIAFPLQVRKLPRSSINTRVSQALEVVRLSDFAKRKPAELSGGQQQRVSIARCLVYDPKLILMDEPLGALDKKLRAELQLEIKKIHDDVKVTIIYVTHDQEEALVMSNRICVMNKGCIEQLGPPQDLYFAPHNQFVADFIGESNLLVARIERITDGIAELRTAGGMTVRATATGEFEVGALVKILVRPEAVTISRSGQPNAAGLSAVIVNAIFIGQSTRYILRMEDVRFTVQVMNKSYENHLSVGDSVWIDWSVKDAIVLE